MFGKSAEPYTPTQCTLEGVNEKCVLSIKVSGVENLRSRLSKMELGDTYVHVCAYLKDEMFMMGQHDLSLTFAAVVALVAGIGAVADSLVIDDTAHPSVLALVVRSTTSCH